MVDLDQIEATEVLRLREGDTLIVHVSKPLTREDAETIERTIKAQLTVDVPVIVAVEDVEFTIARPSDEE